MMISLELVSIIISTHLIDIIINNRLIFFFFIPTFLDNRILCLELKFEIIGSHNFLLLKLYYLKGMHIDFLFLS